jgi:Ca2+-binding EF-hand superfamily protein
MEGLTMTKLILAALVLGAPVAASAATADLRQAAIDKMFATMDANHDGHVDKAEYAKFQQARFAKQAQTVDAAVTELDKDKDGKISKAEAATVPEIAKYFDGLDADKDGFLSRAEMQNAMAAAQAADANTN